MHVDESRPGPYHRRYGEPAPGTRSLLDRVLDPDTRTWLEHQHPDRFAKVADAIARAHAAGVVEALSVPIPGVPRSLADALRRGDRTCDLTIAGTPVLVVLNAAPYGDRDRELRIWVAIQNAYHETAAQAHPDADQSTYYLRHDLPPEVAALAWDQDGNRLYATAPGCQASDLRILRRHKQRLSSAPPPTAALMPLAVALGLGQRAAQAVAQLAAAPSAAAVTACTLAIATITPPRTVTDAWAGPPAGHFAQPHTPVEPNLPISQPKSPPQIPWVTPSARPSARPSAILTLDQAVPSETPPAAPQTTEGATPEASPTPSATPTPTPSSTPAPAPTPDAATPTPTIDLSPTPAASPDASRDAPLEKLRPTSTPTRSVRAPRPRLGKPSKQPLPRLRGRHHQRTPRAR